MVKTHRKLSLEADAVEVGACAGVVGVVEEKQQSVTVNCVSHVITRHEDPDPNNGSYSRSTNDQ